MPGFDGTGPQGGGPFTGRGRGYCVLSQANSKPSQVNGLTGIQGTPVGGFNWGRFFQFAGFGIRRRFGGGRGRGRRGLGF